jgi:signal transduction histidine kinase
VVEKLRQRVVVKICRKCLLPLCLENQSIMDAITGLEHTLKTAQTNAEKIQARIALARVVVHNDPKRALSLTEEAETELRRTDEQAEAVDGKTAALFLVKGMAHFYLGNLDEAKQFTEESLVHLEESESLEELAEAQQNLGGVFFKQGNYEQAVKAFEESKAYYETLGMNRQVAIILSRLGNIARVIGDYASAFKHLEECERIFQSIGEVMMLSEPLNSLGILFNTQGDFETSIEYFQKALRVSQASGEKRLIASALTNLGYAFSRLSDPLTALNVLEQGFAIYEELGDRHALANTLTMFATAHAAAGNDEKAVTFLNQSLAISREIHNQIGIIGALHVRAEIETRRQGHEPALQTYQEILEISERLHYKYGEVTAQMGIAIALMELNRYTESEAAFQKAAGLAETHQIKNEQYLILEKRALLYERMNDFENAYRTHRAFYKLKEETFDAEKKEHIAFQQVRFETERAQREAALQKKDAELTRLKNTELAAALRDAKRANEFKTELLGIAAHDLKNPLQSIYGFALILKEELPEAGDHFQFSVKIEESARRMIRIIDDVLHSARMELSEIVLNKESMDIANLLARILDTQSGQLKQKQQHLLTELGENCTAVVDNYWIEEVFENLLSNAVKYSHAGARIAVRCSKEKRGEHDVVQIAVSDEGQGLSERDKEKLFGRFQRLSSKPTGGESSTGLGLSIVKQIVELHGGRVWAESEGKGKGATFFVELPQIQL